MPRREVLILRYSIQFKYRSITDFIKATEKAHYWHIEPNWTEFLSSSGVEEEISPKRH